MAAKSKIEWTERTWNPVTGCTKISPGCANCYAERFAHRLQAMGQDKYRNGFDVTLHKRTLDDPLGWKNNQVIFVNSMSDLFHKDVPLSFIKRVFQTMRRADWHIFQVLTKRSEKLLALDDQILWAPNVWMGVSIENSDYLSRLDDLKRTGAQLKFVSFEPLIGPVSKFDTDGIDWVIVGGESGPGARPMKKEWVIDIRDRCRAHNVPFFFKQWGGTRKKKAGRELDGRTWDQYPETAAAM
ncbi:MAG: phage Gp37/Gp68 family protein [Armatimonadota bacterium]